MPDILLHPTNQTQIDAFVSHPAHAMLLIGPEGIGKQTVVQSLVLRLLNLDMPALEHYPYITYVAPEKDSISIDAIRNLQHLIKLKLPNSQTKQWRIIVIYEAQTLTVEAQNALLKMLEEPPTDTIFIVSTVSEHALLPTILSRVQPMTIHQPAYDDVMRYFVNLGYSDSAVRQAYLLSGGLPGLMTSLLSEDEAHPLRTSVEDARTLLRSTTFERLTYVDSYAKDKTAIYRLVFVLQQMARAALTQNSLKEVPTARQAIARWQRVLDSAYQAEASLRLNAQPKLTLLNLLLDL